MAQENEVTPGEIQSAMFAQLVMMFTSATLQHLGKLVNPATRQAEVDLEAAQASIDMLDMLDAKTRGNLTPEETRMLQDALTQLKLNFVETREAAGAAPAAKPAEPPPAPAAAAAGPGTAGGEIKTPPPAEDKQPRFHKKY